MTNSVSVNECFVLSRSEHIFVVFLTALPSLNGSIRLWNLWRWPWRSMSLRHTQVRSVAWPRTSKGASLTSSCSTLPTKYQRKSNRGSSEWHLLKSLMFFFPIKMYKENVNRLNALLDFWCVLKPSTWIEGDKREEVSGVTETPETSSLVLFSTLKYPSVLFINIWLNCWVISVFYVFTFCRIKTQLTRGNLLKTRRIIYI